MILVITKHLKGYLDTFTTKGLQQTMQKTEQEEFYAIIGVLDNYTPKNEKYIEAKNKLLKIVKNFYKGREKMVKGFKNGIFPFGYDEAWEEEMRYEKEEEELNNIKNKNGLIDYIRLNRLIGAKERHK